MATSNSDIIRAPTAAPTSIRSSPVAPRYPNSWQNWKRLSPKCKHESSQKRREAELITGKLCLSAFLRKRGRETSKLGSDEKLSRSSWRKQNGCGKSRFF